MNAREQICAVLASATFEHCQKVKAAGRERPAVPERHVFPKQSNRLSTFFTSASPSSWSATTNQARQLSFTVECVCVCIVCRVCVLGLLAQAEPSISESSRRGQKESHPLSPLGHRQFRSVFFFFLRKPMARLAENLVNLGLLERPPGGNTHTVLLANRQT